MELDTHLCGIHLKNPTVLASGIMGVTSDGLLSCAAMGAGALTTKSIGPIERTGHPNPIVLTYTGGMINAVGLPNEGIDAALDKLRDIVKKSAVPVIVSIFGGRIAEYADVARKVDEIKPAMIEVNISCPNVEDQFGKPFSCEPDMTRKVTEAVKNNARAPVSIKL